MPDFDVTAPDGKIFRITTPEGGTRDDAIKVVAQNYTPEMSKLERFGTGLKDPLIGAAQLASHIAPETFGKAYKAYEGEDLPAGGYDEVVKAREESIKKSSPEGIDFFRLGGNVAPYLATLPFGGGEVGVARLLGQAALTGGVSGLLEPVTSDTDNFLATKGLQTGLGAATGAAGGALGKGIGAGVNRLGNWAMRKFPHDLEYMARRKILERINEDAAARFPGNARKQAAYRNAIAQKVRDDQAKGIPTTVADVAGPSVQGLAGNVARGQGPGKSIARNLLNRRDEQEGDYLTKVVQRDLEGQNADIKGSIFGTSKHLAEKQRAESRPFYKALDNDFVVPSDKLDVWLNSPDFQKAITKGLEIERIAALQLGEVFDAGAMGIRSGPGGFTLLNARAPNLRFLDTVKKGLDGLVEGETEEVTGKMTQLGRAYNDLRKAFIQEVESLDKNGNWAKARAAWAGPVESREAMEFGENVFKMSPEEIAHTMGQLNPSEQEFARHGAAQTVIKRIQQTGIGGDEAKKIVGNRYMQRQLAPLFRNAEQRDSFLSEMQKAVGRFETRRTTIGGSPTAERIAEDAAEQHGRFRTQALIAWELANSNPLRALGHLYSWWRDIGLRPDDQMNEAIAKILFGTRTNLELAEASGNLTKTGKLPKQFVVPKGFHPGPPHPAAVNLDRSTYFLRRILPQLIAATGGPTSSGITGQ